LQTLRNRPVMFQWRIFSSYFVLRPSYTCLFLSYLYLPAAFLCLHGFTSSRTHHSIKHTTATRAPLW